MKTKILKNKITIEMSNSEYDKLFRYINKLDQMLTTINETNDLWLSDIQNIGDLKWHLVNLLDAEWNPNKYTYIKRGEK